MILLYTAQFKTHIYIYIYIYIYICINSLYRDFPQGPVVKDSVLSVQRGAASIPGWGTKIPHAAMQPKDKKIN